MKQVAGTERSRAGKAAEVAMGAGIVAVMGSGTVEDAGAQRTEEVPEGELVGLLDLLEGQKIFEIFQATVRTRGLTHTPLAWEFHRTVEEWNR